MIRDRLTHEDFERLLKEVDLSKHPYPIKFEAHRCSGNYIEVKLAAKVPDRDTGEPTNVYFSECIHLDDVSVLGFEHYIRRYVHRMVLHEADEAILIGGKRVFDPHAKDRRHATEEPAR